MKYRTSIYGRRRVPTRPTYRKTTLLDLMRAERRLERQEKEFAKIMTDAMVSGVGIGMMHVPSTTYARE